MSITRMTANIRRSLEGRLEDLDRRIETLDAQRKGDDSLESTALMEHLKRERRDVIEVLRDATLIDDEPFDTEAIEIGDTVTIRDARGETERYVLVDGKVRSRAGSDWVSVSSPLGAALLGRNKGDRVYVDSPAGPAYYMIVAFERASEEDVFVDPSTGRRLSKTLKLLPSEAFLG